MKRLRYCCVWIVVSCLYAFPAGAVLTAHNVSSFVEINSNPNPKFESKPAYLKYASVQFLNSDTKLTFSSDDIGVAAKCASLGYLVPVSKCQGDLKPSYLCSSDLNVAGAEDYTTNCCNSNLYTVDSPDLCTDNATALAESCYWGGAKMKLCGSREQGVRCSYDDDRCNKCWEDGVYNSAAPGCENYDESDKGDDEVCCKRGYKMEDGICVKNVCDREQFPYEQNPGSDQSVLEFCYEGDRDAALGYKTYFGYASCNSDAATGGMWKRKGESGADRRKCVCMEKTMTIPAVLGCRLTCRCILPIMLMLRIIIRMSDFIKGNTAIQPIVPTAKAVTTVIRPAISDI